MRCMRQHRAEDLAGQHAASRRVPRLEHAEGRRRDDEPCDAIPPSHSTRASTYRYRSGAHQGIILT